MYHDFLLFITKMQIKKDFSETLKQTILEIKKTKNREFFLLECKNEEMTFNLRFL